MGNMNARSMRRVRGFIHFALWIGFIAGASATESRPLIVGLASFAGFQAALACLALLLPYESGR